MLQILPKMAENIIGHGENDNNQKSYPFPIMFSKAVFLQIVKFRDRSVNAKTKLSLSSIYTHILYNTLQKKKKKTLGKHCGKR